MSADASPPQGYETKSTPGYVPASVPNPDHPGHPVGFAGVAGYSNTPGITDPEPSSGSSSSPEESKASGKAESSKSSTKSGGTSKS